jgi:hypothetical protein
VTGLSWLRFAGVHVPATLLAGVIAAGAAVVVHWARAAHLGSIAILIAAGVVAVAVTLTASKLRPELFLGSHGTWAASHAEELLRRGSRRRAAAGAVSEELASAGKASSE